MKIIDEKYIISREIRKSKNVFLMAHKDLDLDALGSCIGMYLYLKSRKKKCYIIIDDQNHELGVEKVIIELEGCIEIIKSENIEKYLDPREKKNLLIILDTNKSELVQSKELLKRINRQMIIDHHDKGKSSIKNAIEIIDNETSSTCEMVTYLLEAFDINIESYYATVLLAGIVLDTNNFTLKTKAPTYYAAFYLSNFGASAKKVQYLLKQDLIEYTEREKLLTDVEIINNKIAITKASPHTKYRREDLAKVAETLLFFNNIEASFVIGKIDKDIIGISARSLGNFDINKILVKLGGGGDTYSGAAKFENTTISKVEEELKKVLEEG